MKTPKEYIIFPLDVASAEQAKKYVRILSDDVGMFKIGLELFINSGHEMIRFIHTETKSEIFLDLKLHDIPETVYRAMKSVADLGIRFATVHCCENRKMLEAAVEGAGGKVGVLGVTILTSISWDDIRQAGFKRMYFDDMLQLVLKRAEDAKFAGCEGVICSGHEAAAIKKVIGKNIKAVTPGIRPIWSVHDHEDQKRVATPGLAVRSGADYLVIGRPIRDAADPKDAVRRIKEEIERNIVP